MLAKIKEKIVVFCHDALGWGFPDKFLEIDDFQPTRSCKYCEQRLAQDSTGAWFHLSDHQQWFTIENRK